MANVDNNIIIYGARGVGKTTLIKRLLCELDIQDIGGFWTKREEPNKEGVSNVYIHDASKNDFSFEDKNFIGMCVNQHSAPNPLAFDTYGAEILKSIDVNKIVIMDEIGFFENEAYKFQDAVKEVLSSDKIVIAAIKDKSTKFLDFIRDNNVNVFCLTEQNRDEIFLQIKDILSKKIIGAK